MSPELERETRKRRIDPRLKAVGWRIQPFEEKKSLRDYGQAAAVEEYETLSGPADYTLVDDGQVLGVVEAKKLTVGPGGILPQAERYSAGIAAEDAPAYGEKAFKAPFLYSTNGEIVRFHDVRHDLNLSREVSGFHTPSALRELLERSFADEAAALTAVPANTYLRDYQLEANQAIEEAIDSRRRTMLLAMATGTGKTVTLVNEIYRLMKSGVARRVLFLVDRRALAAQAVRTFASFEAEPGLKFDKIYEVYSQRFHREDLEDDKGFDPRVIPTRYLTDPQPGHTFVYVSTIQRMTINLFGRDAAFPVGDEEIEDDAAELDIPIHAFDLIVADECHRGYSSSEVSVWRKTLDHFDAVKVGLTATPAGHTMAYFEPNRDQVTYRYDYERAVREGHLVDYDAVRIRSDVRLNGVFLKKGEHVASVDTQSGQQQFDFLEDERVFDTTKVEREITAPESNRKILAEIKRYAEEHEKETGRFPKTLIFAHNDLPHTSHADQVVTIAREMFGRGESFVAKITGRVDRPLQKIREFRNRPNPGIAVTVDLLTTGIDIPDLEFLVFLRPVKSRILFEQMLGRGTRKGDRFPDKSHFVVFDCFDGTLLEYFRNATAITAEPPESDTKTTAQIIEEIWQNRDREYNMRRLVKRLQRIEKQMSGDARELFARFIPEGDVGAFAVELPVSLHRDFTGTMKILRDEDFQELLLKYPRPPRSFIVALEATDVVESEWLIKGATGREYKPQDYLQAFEAFVKSHSTEVEAISILLSRPQSWSPQALHELRQALAQAAEHFTEVNLQRAFQVTHRKALVDIISMVKRAAAESADLLTAEERVAAAIGKVTDGREFSVDQAKWLDYIRQHLIANLSIDREDFDTVPVLSNRGGWGRANKVFEGALADFLEELIKELVAA
jgi:type I restriction enzyme R subunit